MIQLVLAAGVVVALLSIGTTDAGTNQMIARIAAAAAIVLIFPFVYAIKFIRTPPAMDADQREAQMALEAKRDDRDLRRIDINTKLRAVEEISQMRGRYREMLKRKLPNKDDALVSWKVEANQLRDEAFERMKLISPGEANNFKVHSLSTTISIRGVTGNHAKWKSALNHDMDVLEQFVTHYSRELNRAKDLL